MMVVILAVLMFAAAIVFSMLGQGGGVLYTPIQVWAGIDFHVAAATSLFLIMIMSLSASIVYRKAKRIDWPLAIVLESVTSLGGFAGGLWSAQFGAAFLSVMFAVVVGFAAFFMIRQIDTVQPRLERPAGFPRWRRTLGKQTYVVNLALALPVSFVAGVASGMLGVGGGILKVPMMVLLFGIPMDIAVGSSAFMVGLTAAGGFAGHVTSGHWDWKLSLALAAAVFAGGQVGSRISVTLDEKKLRKGFGWFLLVIALFMVLRIWIHSQ